MVGGRVAGGVALMHTGWYGIYKGRRPMRGKKVISH